MTDDATTAGLRDAVEYAIDAYADKYTERPYEESPVRRKKAHAALTAYGDRRAAVARRDALRVCPCTSTTTGHVCQKHYEERAVWCTRCALLADAEKALEADGKQA